MRPLDGVTLLSLEQAAAPFCTRQRRHTRPAAGALLSLMRREGLSHEQIASVTARVHRAAVDVLGPVVEPRSIHQARFSRARCSA